MKFLGKLFTIVGVAMLGVVGALAQTEDTVTDVLIDAIQQSALLQVAVSEVQYTNFPSQGPVSTSMTRVVPHLLLLDLHLIRK